MGFATQAEADLVLTSALLYDLGRIADAVPMDESLRETIGFAPHPQSLAIVAPHLTSTHPANPILKEALVSGYCNAFPAMYSYLKWDAALPVIERKVTAR